MPLFTSRKTIPTLATKSVSKESAGVEASLMAMQDSVIDLTSKVSKTERRTTHNPPGMGFKERGGPFTRAIT